MNSGVTKGVTLPFRLTQSVGISVPMKEILSLSIFTYYNFRSVLMCPNHCKLVEHFTFLLFIFGCMYLDSIPNLDYLCFNSFLSHLNNNLISKGGAQQCSS